MKKFILVCGGVMSGVGKGIATASIGKILQEYGYKVTAIKIDPYINFDAGTLRPTEHGEVFVTYDGGETDQDLGSYERFLNQEISRSNNITTGQIYKKIIDKERNGEFLGKTVQFIPHVPDEIKKRILASSKKANAEITLVELGGTIGDFENVPFLFTIKSLEKDLGKDNLLYVLVSYLPIPKNIGEMKTKPTQQAIKMLAENGIYPDIILARSHTPLDKERKQKIEKYANISDKFVISAPDIKTVYKVPLNFEKENLGKKILEKLKLKARKKPYWRRWTKLVDSIENTKKQVKIAIVGKYISSGSFSLTDSYISINEALKHAAAFLNCSVKITWFDSVKLQKQKNEIKKLKDYDGIIVPGGFGSSGIEGKINAIKFARENNISFLGLCLGMQLAVVEFARSRGLKANSTEFNKKTKNPVVCILPEQKKLIEEHKYGATMRLGEYAAILKENSLVYNLYKKTSRLKEDMKKISIFPKAQRFRLGKLRKYQKAILERHRHRYEVNPSYISLLEKNGLIFSAYHHRFDNTKLMEFLELPRAKHKFFVATQTHPEFKSRFLKPAPIFVGFVKSCLNNRQI